MVTVRLPFCSTSTLSIGRERENKLKKKMCKKKEKKRLNCFCFFFGNMSPFPFFPYSWFPNPKCCISSAPTPKVPSSGVGLGQEVVRETVTGRGNTQDRDQEKTRGEGTTGRQKDHAFRALVRGASGREWGDTLVPSRPVCCPPARTRGPGKEAQFLPGPGCPELREQTELLPVCAGPTWEQLGPPNPHHPERANTERG